MSRGQADFGALAVKEVSASISDMGEVAARLGSIVIYDKRGDVVEFDTFEEPVLRWRDGSTGDGFVRLASDNARSGSQALYMKTDTTLGTKAQIERGTSVVGSKRLGFEISLSKLLAGSTTYPKAYFYLWVGYYDGENEQGVGVRIISTTGAASIAIYNSAETWETIAEIVDLQPQYFLFQTLKLVVDFDAGKYVRLLFANIEYDISAYAIWTDTSDTAPYILTQFYLENPGTDLGECWIDDYIFTQAEP